MSLQDILAKRRALAILQRHALQLNATRPVPVYPPPMQQFSKRADVQ